MWASEDLILTVLFTYQELAKRYIRISRIVYNELSKDKLVEPNKSFIKKIDLIEKSINYYNSKNQDEKEILKSTMMHFNLFHKSTKWHEWNYPYNELISHYEAGIKFYTDNERK